MAVRLLVAVTDRDWFEHVRTRPALSEVNFWAPGAAPFGALEAGELFLFKLHAPLNLIVGGGVFTYANTLPCSLAWEAFHEGNGATSLADMRQRIIKYRRVDAGVREDFSIGCRIAAPVTLHGETIYSGGKIWPDRRKRASASAGGVKRAPAHQLASAAPIPIWNSHIW